MFINFYFFLFGTNVVFTVVYGQGIFKQILYEIICKRQIRRIVWPNDESLKMINIIILISIYRLIYIISISTL